MAALRRVAANDLSALLFSVRVPGESTMLAGRGETKIARVPFDDPDPACAAHAAVYRLRADAGGILTARQPWASRLARLPEPMPAVFDEQVRQLGQRVERFSSDAVRGGANAFLVNDGVLIIGFTAARAVLNAELLEKCAKAYLLASLTGRSIGRIPMLIRIVAGRRLRKDQKRAAEFYSRGEMPPDFSTY